MLLSNEQLNKISDNFLMSQHAIERIEDRLELIHNKKYIVSKMVKNSKFAYFNNDGSINVAINKYEYFVFTYDTGLNKYIMITFKERSHNGNNIYDKYELALKGVKR